MSFAKVGQPAPEFTAACAFPGESGSAALKSVSLSDYRGKWLVFFWYPMDFTFVCPTEITALSDRYAEFQDLGCEVLGASTDSVYSHRAWLRTPRDQNGIEGVEYPILSDMTHKIAESYGVLIEGQGIALRGLFIIDPDGVLQYATINNLNLGRSVDETLRVLQGLQSGGLCPSDWKPGQKTLKPGE
ncbi:MAG TPA: peroxiredoxin [Armatimonadaceae bacterium]|jgi:alkyl hydroperoxide reductase subunit AhpC|nr:peroxiredoxin [Armatimonadaceae bacterium]